MKAAPPISKGVIRLLLALTLVPGASLAGQDPPTERSILESQRRLDEVRQERARLQQEMSDLRSQAQSASSQLRNIERQLSASRTVLAEVDFQVEARSAEVDVTATALAQAQTDLTQSRTTLKDRLRSIYKRGPLHTARVLLSADSFANLLTRFRYLRLVAAQDRAILDRVATLEAELTLRNRELQESLAELHRLRDEKSSEVSNLERVEGQREQALTRYRAQVAETESRLAVLTETENRLSGLIGDIEEDRVREEGAAPSASGEGGGGAGGRPAGAPTAGTLQWPVDGNLIYRFGRQRQPNGTVLRWNGIGIQASEGTPVHAVLPGSVSLAGPFEGYGPMVVLSHGDGLYTLYLYLRDIFVVQGRYVDEGEVLGTVGGGETPEGPHLEFQMRGPVAGSSPQALDPLEWLRP
ncbi:MAG: peptidoglycan DD-metalloendopeptidase family protein, partial [Gemmatimonadetes bacterium]|nr:peptidoglycan DD-metalloendopeptidase family protein [Gemmatimonadota bacterium]